MARSQVSPTRIAPETSTLLTLHVVDRVRLSPSFVRVTVSGADLAGFVPLGRDQWFRLFLPVADGTLSRLPHKLDTLSYLRYLTIAKTERPVLRNYSVSAFRAEGPRGPELDIDFVVHGSASDGTAGPAAAWAQRCVPGDAVAILDEGAFFAPPATLDGDVVLVGDETALPAIGGILASLPPDATGRAFIEVPEDGDVRDLPAPAGIDVRWSVRAPGASIPGAAALDAVAAETAVPAYGWVAGEQSLVAATRRLWVRAGVDKRAISFTGYWRRPSRSRAPR